MIASNRYRSHTCAVLRPEHIGQPVKLAGWVHRKRDHGSLLFIDLRDHYGITQCVFTPNSAAFSDAESVRLESVISVSGNVIERTSENVNPALPTGGVEVKADALEVLSTAELLPFQVAGTQDIPEEQRCARREERRKRGKERKDDGRLPDKICCPFGPHADPRIQSDLEDAGHHELLSTICRSRGARTIGPMRPDLPSLKPRAGPQG